MVVTFTPTDTTDYSVATGAAAWTIKAAVAAVSVEWGSQIAQLQTAADGMHLLPAGRTTDLPWDNINKLAITLNQAAALSPGDVSVIGMRGGDYGPRNHLRLGRCPAATTPVGLLVHLQGCLHKHASIAMLAASSMTHRPATFWPMDSDW